MVINLPQLVYAKTLFQFADNIEQNRTFKLFIRLIKIYTMVRVNSTEIVDETKFTKKRYNSFFQAGGGPFVSWFELELQPKVKLTTYTYD